MTNYTLFISVLQFMASSSSSFGVSPRVIKNWQFHQPCLCCRYFPLSWKRFLGQSFKEDCFSHLPNSYLIGGYLFCNEWANYSRFKLSSTQIKKGVLLPPKGIGRYNTHAFVDTMEECGRRWSLNLAYRVNLFGLWVVTILRLISFLSLKCRTLD